MLSWVGNHQQWAHSSQTLCIQIRWSLNCLQRGLKEEEKTLDFPIPCKELWLPVELLQFPVSAFTHAEAGGQTGPGFITTANRAVSLERLKGRCCKKALACDYQECRKKQVTFPCGFCNLCKGNFSEVSRSLKSQSAFKTKCSERIFILFITDILHGLSVHLVFG